MVFYRISVPLRFFSSVCCVQCFNSHTRTFDLQIPVGLHGLMMHTQVTTINIQRLHDPVEHSEAVDEPPSFPKDYVCMFL